MFELSDAAKNELTEYFKNNEKGPIRVFLAPGGCSGPRLALALDEPTDTDKTEEIGEFNFCINNDLLDQIKSAKIDFSPYGFVVEPENPLPDTGSGGGCGGCCGGCGSH